MLMAVEETGGLHGAQSRCVGSDKRVSAWVAVVIASDLLANHWLYWGYQWWLHLGRAGVSTLQLGS